MITLSDAAEALERICDTVSSADEITDEMLHLFQINTQNVAQEVDRAFRYKMYLESQLEHSDMMMNQWKDRRTKMAALLQRLKMASLAVAKSTTIPLKGEMGKIAIRKNSHPSLQLEGFDYPPEYWRTERVLNKDKIRNDIADGKEITGASLVWGEHIRFTM